MRSDFSRSGIPARSASKGFRAPPWLALRAGESQQPEGLKREPVLRNLWLSRNSDTQDFPEKPKPVLTQIGCCRDHLPGGL